VSVPVRAVGDDRERPWVEGVRHGDADAYEAMFRAYAAPLCAFACRMVRSRAVAEELVHDVFLSIWARRKEWDPRGSLKAYLFRAVQNRALNVTRRERVARAFVEREAAWGEPRVAPTADRQTLRDEGQATVLAAVAELPPRMRAVFMLRWSNRLSFAEIGQQLGIAPKTAENHMGRAVALLRAALPALGVPTPDD
jgi:RNA polymerase sigma-70 factor (ECF subfamily)